MLTDDLAEFLVVTKNKGGQLSIGRLLNNTLGLNQCFRQGSRQANSGLQDIPIASRPSTVHTLLQDLNLLILLLTQLFKFALELLELFSLVLELNLFGL